MPWWLILVLVIIASTVFCFLCGKYCCDDDDGKDDAPSNDIGGFVPLVTGPPYPTERGAAPYPIGAPLGMPLPNAPPPGFIVSNDAPYPIAGGSTYQAPYPPADSPIPQPGYPRTDGPLSQGSYPTVGGLIPQAPYPITTESMSYPPYSPNRPTQPPYPLANDDAYPLPGRPTSPGFYPPAGHTPGADISPPSYAEVTGSKQSSFNPNYSS